MTVRHDGDPQGPGARRDRGSVAQDGSVIAVGLSLLVLAGDGRIERDYTFIVA
jgi:hypothetical protein